MIRNGLKKIIAASLCAITVAAATISGVGMTKVHAEEAEKKISETTMLGNTRNWMAYLKDSIPITEINLPGTHDSGTKYIQGSFVGSIGGNTQDYTIDKQMNKGIRAFDIRVSYDLEHAVWDGIVGSNWEHLTVWHGVFACYRDVLKLNDLKLKDVFDYASEFVKNNPTEVIVLKLQQENNKRGGSDMVKSALKKLRDSKMPYDNFVYVKEADKVPNLGDVRGKVIILDNEGQATYTKYEDHYDVDPDTKSDYLYKILNTCCNQDVYGKYSSAYRFREDDYLKNENQIGEPVVKYVFSSCVDLLHGWTPSRAADKVNPWFDKMLDNTDTGKRIGWVMMDFPTDSLISKVIRSNSVNAFKDPATVIICGGATSGW